MPHAAVRITLRDATGKGKADIFALQGEDGRSGYGRNGYKVKKFDGLSAVQIDSFFASVADFYRGGARLG